MHVIIIGNGIIGLTTAYRLIKKDQNVKITLVGPSDNKGCASLAAAAMFNSFCEIDSSTLTNKIEREKWLFNKSATSSWPSFLKEIEEDSSVKQNFGFGTFLINNHSTDALEDVNFEAIVSALKEFNEPYSEVNANEIVNYNPQPKDRASRAIFIDGEGWVNPILLVSALKTILEKSGRVSFVNGYAEKLHKVNGKIDSLILEGGEKITGDTYFLSPGATFSKIIDASDLGLQFPRIFYGVGCSILLKTDGLTLSNCVRTPNRGLACGVYSAPQDATHTLIGASNFISPWPEDNARATSVYALLKSAIEQINQNYYRAQLVKVNVGWRPTSEDTLPLIGKTSIANLLVTTGTKRDGLHCSPIISNYISDLILNGQSEEDYSLFVPERSPVRFLTRKEAIEQAVKHTINAAYQHDFVSAKNRMVDDLTKYYTDDLEKLHDSVGAYDWGIPSEMINMYRYKHIM